MASVHTSSIVSNNIDQLLDSQKNKKCGWITNCYSMCCNNDMVDQVQLFKNQAINNDPSQIAQINQTTSFIEEEDADFKFGKNRKQRKDSKVRQSVN